jgi:transglutaminase/protease-like cytokinesis protein 3
MVMVENRRRRGSSLNKSYKKSIRHNPNRNFQPILLLIFGVIVFTVIKKIDRDQLSPEIGRLREKIDEIIPDNFHTNLPSLDLDEPNNPSSGKSLTGNEAIYSTLDKLASSLNYQGSSTTELATILSRYGKNDLEKARLIYSWITSHIDYDAPSFFDGSYVRSDSSPEAVLRKRLTVCSGYANLFQALAKAMNLEAVVIEGYAKGDSYGVGGDRDVNHAWSAVKIDNAWYLMDTTWGAGTLSGKAFQPKFNPYYFAIAPQQLIYSHYPVKEKWQLLSQPYPRADFDQLPKVFSYFFKHGIDFVSHKTQQIQANGRLDVVLSAPTDTLVSAQLLSGSSRLDDSYTFVQRQGNNFVISATAPNSGNYELAIFVKNKQDSGNYYQAIAYNLRADNVGQDFPKAYSTFIESGAYLHTPNVRSLPKNSLVRFQLSLPAAEEVVAINEREQWTKLDHSGNDFSGNVAIGSGKIRIAAKFPNSRQYAVLLEYD